MKENVSGCFFLNTVYTFNRNTKNDLQLTRHKKHRVHQLTDGNKKRRFG